MVGWWDDRRLAIIDSILVNPLPPWLEVALLGDPLTPSLRITEFGC